MAAGDTARIRAMGVRKQQTDRNDAVHRLGVLLRGSVGETTRMIRVERSWENGSKANLGSQFDDMVQCFRVSPNG